MKTGSLGASFLLVLLFCCWRFALFAFLLLCELGQNPIFLCVVALMCWWISVFFYCEFLFIAELVVWLSFSFQFDSVFSPSFIPSLYQHSHFTAMQRFTTIPCGWTHDRWTDILWNWRCIYSKKFFLLAFQVAPFKSIYNGKIGFQPWYCCYIHCLHRAFFPHSNKCLVTSVHGFSRCAMYLLLFIFVFLRIVPVPI